MKRGTLKAVEAEDLGKRFGALEALKGFNLDVGQGEIFGLLGPDGAGKTTALRLLASVMKPSCGDAWIMGYHVVRQASKVRENIGYMARGSASIRTSP
jgi:ABC-type multidrug transport system ATPase subunit